MVVAEEAVSLRTLDAGIDTTGVIVGFLIRRPALWTLVPRAGGPHKPGKPGKDKDSLPHRTLHQRNVKIANVGVYDNCTASMLVSFMSDGNRPYWRVKDTESIQPGQEWAYSDPRALAEVPSFTPFAGTVPPTGSSVPDVELYVTCDALLAKLHCRFKPRTTVFSWAKFSQVPDFPFTAIVVRRDWLASPPGLLATRLLLYELHTTMSRLFSSNNDMDVEAEACAAAFLLAQSTNGEDHRIDTSEARYPRVRDGNEFEGLRTEVRQYFIPALKDMCADRGDFDHQLPVYARRLSPDWSHNWIRTGWGFSCNTLWGLGADPADPSCEMIFRRCTSNCLAVSGLINAMKGAVWWIRNRAIRVDLILFSVIAVMVVTSLIAVFDRKVRDALNAWEGARYPVGGIMDVLHAMWWPSDMVSLGAIVPLWCLASAVTLIVGGWVRLAFPRLDPRTQRIHSRGERWALSGITLLLIVLLLPLRLLRSLARPVLQLLGGPSARR